MLSTHVNAIFTKKYVQIATLLVALVGSLVILGIKSREDYNRYFVSADSFDTAAVRVDLAASEVLSVQTTGKIYRDDALQSDLKTADKRVYVLDQYFLSRNSPLYGTAQYFVGACMKYDAPEDCTVAVAIASNETHLCTYHISAEQHNCWGWGGAGANRVKFPDFKTAIYRVTEVLVNNYGVDAMNDPSLMERKFCGPQEECRNWGEAIKIQMNQLEEFSKSIGMGSLYGLRRER